MGGREGGGGHRVDTVIFLDVNKQNKSTWSRKQYNTKLHVRWKVGSSNCIKNTASEYISRIIEVSV